MNNPPSNKKIILKARHIGPILQLDAPLDKNRNMIFARNGTGKSFLARALRMLDTDGFKGRPEAELPPLLVSEESPDRKGTFEIYEGPDMIGGINLDCRAGAVVRAPPRYIFHVFAEDYVSEQIRNQLGNLNGNIESEILIGKESAELSDKKGDLSKKEDNASNALALLQLEFAKQKAGLKSRFDINASLTEFKALTLEPILGGALPNDSSIGETLESIGAAYQKLKSLPLDPKLPMEASLDDLRFDPAEYETQAARETKPASVSESIKEKISRNHEFFRFGADRFKVDPSHCAFCDQRLEASAIDLINQFVLFFEDEEARHRTDIEALRAKLVDIGRRVEASKATSNKARASFLELKAYFPAFPGTAADLSELFDAISKAFRNLYDDLTQKLQRLGERVPVRAGAVQLAISRLSSAIDLNRRQYRDFAKTLENSGEERRRLQRLSCGAFLVDFCRRWRNDLDGYCNLKAAIRALALEIEALVRVTGSKASARERVADTFTLLLSRFFGSRYDFDRGSFKLRRLNKEMLRGVERTISDGERSIIAFCYFIAQVHLRVSSAEDYQRVFLVVDDPVSSISFDYIFEIAQCIKRLRFDAAGNANLSGDDTQTCPKMLLLTHNDYFYNIVLLNNIIKEHSVFELVSIGSRHETKPQATFVTPHLSQIREVRGVADGTLQPTFSTPNAIRSVLEGIWKFCHPELKSFDQFVKLLERENLEVRSVLLHSFSHGGHFTHSLRETEVILAAKEAVEVVRKFASGQLE